MINEELLGFLRCPRCKKSDFDLYEGNILCKNCNVSYILEKEQIPNFVVMIYIYYDGFGHDLYKARLEGNIFERVFHSHRVNTVLRWIKCMNVQKRDKILDLGCNTGPVLIPLVKRGYKVFGLDIIKTDVLTASKNLTDNNCRPDILLIADGKNLPIVDDFFDVVLLVDELEHTSQPFRIVKEVRRVLKSGGFVYVSVPWKWHPVVKFDGIRKILSSRKTIEQHPDIPFDLTKLKSCFEGFKLIKYKLVYYWTCIGAILKNEKG